MELVEIASPLADGRALTSMDLLADDAARVVGAGGASLTLA